MYGQVMGKSVEVDTKFGRLAFFMALAGYVPFFVLTLAIGPFNGLLSGFTSQLALPSWFFAHVLTVYGAIILSFLGGIRWGIAMVGVGLANTRLQEIAWSTIPAIAGWVAVFLPRSEGLYFLAGCFLIQGFWDVRLVSADRVPQWYSTLRLVLTLLVVATVIVAGVLA